MESVREPCVLESREHAAILLENYDSVRERWNIPKRERFWNAVAIAHAVGRKGQGVRIAIIDGTFDIRMNQIARRTRIHRPMPEPGGREHGTAVALLMTEVAPEAEFDLYEVCTPNGVPQYQEVCKAVAEATRNGADIISLSLGRYQTHEQDRKRHGGQVPKHYLGQLSDQVAENACELCREASAAMVRGVYTVAAAGNNSKLVLCPARSSDVIGCGFHHGIPDLIETPDGDGTIEANVGTPPAQSNFVDFTIEEIAGVLGTSFATPLFAAFLALCEEREHIPAFFKSLYTASGASMLEVRLRQQPRREDLIEIIEQLYRDAYESLPHTHSDDMNPCPECSLFAETVYANWGRFLLNIGNVEAAEWLLRIGHTVLPRSPHVTANLGSIVHSQARAEYGQERQRLFDEAENLYREACEYVAQDKTRAMYLATLGSIALERNES